MIDKLISKWPKYLEKKKVLGKTYLKAGFSLFLTVTGPIGYTPHGTVWQSTAKKSVTPFSLVLGSN